MKKYESKGTSDEALDIFLYSLLIYKNRAVDKVTLDDYQEFELRDVYVKSYNEWLDGNPTDLSKVEQWIETNQEAIQHFKENFDSEYKAKVELWSDRKKTPYYKEKLQGAFEFENEIAKLIMENYGMDLGQYLTPEGQYNLGENSLGIEIKNDTLIKKYGNVYIEYAEKSNPRNIDYVPSGILKNDNTKYFLIGTKEQFWIFRKQRLVEIYKEEKALKDANKTSKRGISFKEKPTSLGFVFPVRNTGNDSITLDEVISEIRAERE